MSRASARGPGATPAAADRLLKGLGLAARAGRLRVGTDAVSRAIEKGQATAVVIANDAPGHVRRKLDGYLSVRSLPRCFVLDGDTLGRAVGRERVVALAITDESLGRRLLELAEAVTG